jgi:hypothetical protein
MWDDPIVEEVRAIRDAHAKKFNYDLKAIAADLKKRQKAGKRRVVTLRSRKPVILPKAKVEKGN